MQCIISSLLLFIIVSFPVAAGPTNNTYELIEYGFGNGGTDNSTNTNYKLNAIIGEQQGGVSSNGTYKVGGGLIFTHLANIPPAPTFSNPASNYDRLHFIVTQGGNPNDTTYALAISKDDFISTQYIQNDGTIGTVLGAEDWQTYTNWGGTLGSYVTGLQQSTSYTIKVKAKQGNFTESGYGPSASATTVDPSLTFSVSANAITFTNLHTGNSYTDSSKATLLTTSTNAYNGYLVYGHVTGLLTSGSTTIPEYSSPNSAPSVWSGTGFGYTTNDSSLAGGIADRFTNGGPKYAGFTTSTPGDPVADHPGPVLSPVVNEQFTISYRVTTTNMQKAGSYSSNIIYTIVPTF